MNFIKPVRELFSYVSARRKRQLILLLGLMFAGAFAELFAIGAVVPFIALLADPDKAFEYPLLQSLFEFLGWADPSQIILPTTVLFISVVVASVAIRLLLNYANVKLAFGLSHDIAVQLYRNVLFQPYSYHVSRNTSEILAGVGKSQAVSSACLVPMTQGISSIIIATFIVSALVWVAPYVAIGAALTFSVVYIFISFLFRIKLSDNSAIISQSQSRQTRAVQEGLGGIRDVILDSAQSQYARQFGEINARLRSAQAANAFIGKAPRFVVEAFGIALIAILALVISERSDGLSNALPVLGAIALGTQRLMPLFQTVYLSWSKLQGNQKVLEDILEFLRKGIAEEHFTRIGSHDLQFREEIELCDMSFQYGEGSPKVLKNISLRITKGARIGFVGQTGSGKSTLLDIIMGLLEPTEGSLRIDGVAIKPMNRRAWQARVAHVPQSIFLTDASIAENIAFNGVDEAVDISKVHEAAKKAQLHEYILQLAEGYDTRVGERGVRMSGGQRQRIGIARALYKNAEVLVLDEATSALDSQTEKAVMEALNNLEGYLTVLIIAHRVTTLRHSDFLVSLENGSIKIIHDYDDYLSEIG